MTKTKRAFGFFEEGATTLNVSFSLSLHYWSGVRGQLRRWLPFHSLSLQAGPHLQTSGIGFGPSVLHWAKADDARRENDAATGSGLDKATAAARARRSSPSALPRGPLPATTPPSVQFLAKATLQAPPASAAPSSELGTNSGRDDDSEQNTAIVQRAAGRQFEGRPVSADRPRSDDPANPVRAARLQTPDTVWPSGVPFSAPREDARAALEAGVVWSREPPAADEPSAARGRLEATVSSALPPGPEAAIEFTSTAHRFRSSPRKTENSTHHTNANPEPHGEYAADPGTRGLPHRLHGAAEATSVQDAVRRELQRQLGEREHRQRAAPATAQPCSSQGRTGQENVRSHPSAVSQPSPQALQKSMNMLAARERFRSGFVRR